MRAKSLALLSLALGCGLVASIGITQVMAKRSTPSVPMGVTENIYVAARDIPLNEVLTAQLLKLEQWPKDKVPPGSITKLEEIEGRRCRTRLYAGEAILKNKLFGKGQGDFGGTSAQIPVGMRAVPVRVDAVSGASGLILPGDRVDLIVHLMPNPAAGIKEPTTRTVLQNIKVFAVDTVTDLEKVDGEGKSIQAKTISLLVTPAQAQKVTLATELGQVRLIMRSPEDDSDSRVDGVTMRELFGAPGSGQLAKDEAPVEQGKPTATSDFLDLLKSSMKSEPVKTAEPAKAIATESSPSLRYKMRLLLGTRRGEAVFEPQAEVDGKEAWRLVGEEDGGAAGSAAGLSTSPSTPDETQAPGTPPTPDQPEPGGKANGGPTGDGSQMKS